MAAGFAGAARGLAGLALACVVVVSIPVVIVSLSNRGTIDLDAFLPRASQSPSRSGELQVKGSTEEQTAVREAVDGLVWPIDASAFRVEVLPRQDLPADAVGMYASPESVVYVDSAVVADPIRRCLSYVLAHEIGHMVDSTRMDDAAQEEFQRLRGRTPSADWEAAEAQWQDRPQEDFAEVFAALDAPFTALPIQTSAGGMEDPVAIRRLIEGLQPGPSRPNGPLNIFALVSTPRSVVDVAANSGLTLQALLGLAMVCSSVCAVDSMRNLE